MNIRRNNTHLLFGIFYAMCYVYTTEKPTFQRNVNLSQGTLVHTI